MRAGKSHRRLTLALAAVLAAVSAPALADFKREYAKGLDAAKDQNWSELQALMQKALSEEQTPQARVKLYGTASDRPGSPSLRPAPGRGRWSRCRSRW